MRHGTPKTTRSWDAMVSDLEVLTSEMREKADEGEQPEPPEPPDGDVIYVEGGDLAQSISSAPAGAILDLCGETFTQAAMRIDKPLTLRNGTVLAATNINDMLELRGQDITLLDMVLRGNGTTKRGIANQAINTVLRNVRIENICREGQETQALAMWSSPGPLLAEDCYFEAGSIPFLAGGSHPDVPNTVATGLTFRRCVFTRPLEWRSRGYACKNAFELKCAKDVLVEDCEMSNVWPQGQSGWAIMLTPEEYGDSPATTTDNVRFVRCYIHDCAGGVNLNGFSQMSGDQTTQSGRYRFEQCRWVISRAQYTGHGTLMVAGHQPVGVEFIDNDVTQDGDAFLRFADDDPVTGFVYRGGTVRVPGTYGVFSPLGNRGAKWAEIAPGGVIEGVTFTNADSTFKKNFPSNIYETA
jgi:hypothetical protein